MELQELEQAFVKATVKLDEARVNLHLKAEAVIETRDELSQAKAAAIVENKFDGKNAETREAQAVIYFSDKLDELSEHEANERSAKAHLELAQSAMALLQYRLRIAELISK